MGLLKLLTSPFRRGSTANDATSHVPAVKHEVDPQVYFSRFLKSDDSKQLQVFLKECVPCISVPCSILAVGSSVFPSDFWDYRRQLNKDDPIARALESYDDIDLLVVPIAVTPLAVLERSVQNALTACNYDWRACESTTAGVSYHAQADGSHAPFLHFNYGLHSITTQLHNGTRLDLILGRNDLLTTTAQKKIALERKENYAFSQLK